MRLEHRGLDLDEARVVEEAADRGDHLRARDERGARLLAGEQVDLAVAVTGLDVGEAVVLVGRRAQRLGEQLEAGDLERELARARLHHGPVDADQVAEVELEQPREGLLAEDVDAGHQLHPAGAVDEVEERGLALPAARGEAAGDARGMPGLLARLELLVRRLHRGDGLHAGERVRERLDTGRAELCELAPPVGEDLRELWAALVRHGPRRRRSCRSSACARPWARAP